MEVILMPIITGQAMYCNVMLGRVCATVVVEVKQ